MSVREEDKEKSGCSSRGLGIAAAIGVGVGAAMYYFLSKRQEQPDTQGSTSSAWAYNDNTALLHVHSINSITSSIITSLLHASHSLSMDDTFSTISEHTTTDTSMYSDSETSDDTSEPSESPESNVISWETSNDDSENSSTSESQADPDLSSSESQSDMEWDITTSSADVPYDRRSPLMFFNRLTQILSPRRRTDENQNLNKFREDVFRQRSWSLEECSICFEVMLNDQELMKLPCTHNFHTQCVMPWLQEKQTCPNCRKDA